jgi:aubergine-like protein
MLMSVCTKVAIQMNCKLGGEIWRVDIPPRGVMVVGIDTYHDSAQKGRSVAAVVSTMNSSLTRYYSRTCFQMTGEELINGLRVRMRGTTHRQLLDDTTLLVGFFLQTLWWRTSR